MKTIKIYGASSGWKGKPMAYGWSTGKEVKGIFLTEPKPINTPLMASYLALLGAFKWAWKEGIKEVKIVSEEHTLINQMNRVWAIHNKPYAATARHCLAATQDIRTMFSLEKKQYWEDDELREAVLKKLE